MYGDPEMISGRRDDVVAKDAPITRAQAIASLKKGPDLKTIRRMAAIKLATAAGLPVYESNYSRLQVQVASPRDLPDANGRVRSLPGIKARFNFGLYTPMSHLRKGTKDHKAEVDLIIEAMESHPKFGLGKLFWKAVDAQNVEKEAAYAEAVKLLSDDEELRSRFLAQVTSGELDASVLKTQRKRKDAIENARGGDAVRPRNAPTSMADLSEEKDKRALIMEKAERTRDNLARAARSEADGEEPTGDDDAPVLRKKKKKRHLTL